MVHRLAGDRLSFLCGDYARSKKISDWVRGLAPCDKQWKTFDLVHLSLYFELALVLCTLLTTDN
jgi:hypothetical protein